MSRPCLQSATTQLLNRFSSTLRRPLSTITRLSLPSASVSSITRPDMRTLTTAPVLSYPAPTLSTSLPSISNILEDEDNGHLHIMKLTNRGFHLSDDLVVPGGLVLLENKPFLWDVDPPIVKPGHGLEAAWMGWDIERFKVFEVVLPRPGKCAKVLLVGIPFSSIIIVVIGGVLNMRVHG